MTSQKADMRLVPRVGIGAGGAPAPGGGSVFSTGVGTLTELSALDDTLLTDGSLIGVEDQINQGSVFQLIKTGDMATANIGNGMAVATNSGTGRWIRTTYQTTFALTLHMGLVNQ